MAHAHGSGGLCPECMGEAKVREQDLGESLFGQVDIDSVWCLNENEPHVGRNCIKQHSERLDATKVLRSNAEDPQLILHVPFKTAVKLKSFCVVGGGGGSAPSHVKVFVNREDVDFTNAEELKATQEWALAEDDAARILYPVKANRFANISSATFFFDANAGAAFTEISYLGLYGEDTRMQRRAAANIVFELLPNPADHKRVGDVKGVAKPVE